MKKIISLSLSILLIFCLINTVYASSPCNLTLEGKTQLTLNEEFSVSLVISNIQDSNGIYVVSSTLTFDKDKLQFCGVENATGWATATYLEDTIRNKGKGKILIERAGKDTAKTNQTVFRIKFKAIKDNVTNANISLSNISVSNTVVDTKLGSIQPLKVNIISCNNSNNSKPGNNNNSNSENNNGDNENNENKDNEDNINDDQNNEDNNISNESSDNHENNVIKREEQDENTKNGNLPSTGNTTNIIILVVIGIAVVGIIATILFIKIRKINKNEQM